MFQSYAVPGGVFLGRRLDGDDDLSERAERLLEARRAERAAWTALLGLPLYLSTTVLPQIGGGQLGPLTTSDGRTLRWGLWAPHRRVLLDLFPRKLPSEDELEQRAAFASAHGLRYGVVPPGRQLTVRSIKEWLES